jgi:putative glutamine amidotransferase
MGEGRRRPLIGITADIEGDRLSLREDYAVAVSRAGGLPVLLASGTDVASCAERLDGLVIPGGGDLEPRYYGEESLAGLNSVPSRRSDFEIAMIHAIIGSGKPLLGICYGMQLVNVALGGTLYQDLKTQLTRAIDHSRSHDIEVVAPGPLKKGTHTVNSTHHQGVKRPGRGLDVLAVSPDGLAEAVSLRGHPFLLCFQWHPERRQGHGALIFNSFVEACHAA